MVDSPDPKKVDAPAPEVKAPAPAPQVDQPSVAKPPLKPPVTKAPTDDLSKTAAKPGVVKHPNGMTVRTF